MIFDCLPPVLGTIVLAYIIIVHIRYRDLYGNYLVNIGRLKQRQEDALVKAQDEELKKREEQCKIEELEPSLTLAQNQLEEIKEQTRQAERQEEVLSMELYTASKGKG